MAESVSARHLLERRVSSNDHVLLLNPPVEETRYSWVRWNQPLDLLKLGSLLEKEVGCRVSLLDFLRPDRQWKVPFEWLPAARRYHQVGGEQYPMRRFGRPYRDLWNWKEALRGSLNGGPSQVWITSLCSYWFDGVAQMVRTVREVLPQSEVVLLGNYPRLLAGHAIDRSGADLLVTEGRPVHDSPAHFALYGSEPPPFVALQSQSVSALSEVELAVGRGVLDFTFFEEDLFLDEGIAFERLLRRAQELNRKVRFHLICGVKILRITPKVAQLLAQRNIAEIHIEEESDTHQLEIGAYHRVRAYLKEAGLEWPTDRLTGFVWIGRPGEDLEGIVRRSLQVLELLGSVILKPFSPTPGTQEYDTYSLDAERTRLRNLSPHLFPFAEMNRIKRGEYHDLYRMAAFLNEKIRNRSFDLFNGTLGSRLLRESLEKEAWKLAATETSTFRVIN